MKNKEAYKQKIRAQLDEWKAEAEKLKARMKKAQADSEIDYSKYIDDLKEKQARARKKLDELEDVGGEAWHEIKEGLEHATAELKKSFGKAREKFSNKQD